MTDFFALRHTLSLRNNPIAVTVMPIHGKNNAVYDKKFIVRRL